MSHRALHPVDCLPERSSDLPERALRAVLESSQGKRVTALPCFNGPEWIVDLDAERIDLFGGADAGELVGLVRRLGEEYGRPDARVQVRVPNALDLTASMMSAVHGGDRRPAAWVVWRLYTAYRSQLVAAVHGLEDAYRGHLQFEVEAPLMWAGLGELRRWQRAVGARVVAFETARFVARFPTSARVVVHWCDPASDGVGVTSAELALVTVMARMVASRVRARNVLRSERQPIPAVHVPAWVPEEQLRQHPDVFAPLAGIPEDVPLYAGVVAADDLASSRLALRAVERVVGREVHAVSTTCGSWPSTAADAGAAMRLMRELAGDPLRESHDG